jgi:hypothetical protein
LDTAEFVVLNPKVTFENLSGRCKSQQRRVAVVQAAM